MCQPHCASLVFHLRLAFLLDVSEDILLCFALSEIREVRGKMDHGGGWIPEPVRALSIHHAPLYLVVWTLP
jgi:hypothetical protein